MADPPTAGEGRLAWCLLRIMIPWGMLFFTANRGEVCNVPCLS